MLAQVEQAIKKHRLLEAGQTVLVAVSGGPDSLALLHALHSLQHKLGISLHIVHIHHGLRPEAGREALMVKKQAILLGLPVSVRRLNPRLLRQHKGKSLQDSARAARYAALAEVARCTGAERIATAHHRDDRVETMLMRLLSGSGLEGLKGIPVRRLLSGGLEVVRPLHDVSREEIEEYCRIQMLSPVYDPSNESLDYYRIRVRLRLLPFLEAEFGRHIRKALAVAADNLAEDAAFLHKLSREAGCEVARQCGGDILLDTAALLSLPPALQSRVVRRALWMAGVNRQERHHTELVRELAGASSPSARVMLPDGVVAAREYGELRVGVPLQDVAVRQDAVEVTVPGKTWLSASGVWLEAKILSRAQVNTETIRRDEACLDFDRLSGPLWVRGRKDGDRMRPLGAPGSRKVKKILVDRKVPLSGREQVPLVFCGEQLIWLAGVEIADFCKVTGQTEKVLYLRLQKQE